MNDTDSSLRTRQTTTGHRGLVALVKFCILLLLCMWMYWPEFAHITRVAMHEHDWAHALVTPIAILALVLLRKRDFVAGVTTGSAWGVLFVTAGLALYAAATWPFDFKYIRDLSILPVLGGIILAAAGTRAFLLSLPMLLLVLLSIPVGSRIYSNLVIQPENYTLQATRATLDQLPGLGVILKGPDLHFSHKEHTGVVALGESRRGVALLPAYLTIAVFIAFATKRPFWQIIILAVAAAPIAFFCNYTRLLTHALTTIYANLDPTSAIPRYVATVTSLLLAYAVFVILCRILSALGSLNRSIDPQDNYVIIDQVKP